MTASRPLAWLLAGAGLALLALMSAGTWAAGPGLDIVGSYVLTNSAFGLGFGGCGLVIALHRPRNPIGWLFLSGALAHLTTAAAAPWAFHGLAAGWPEPAIRLLATIFLIAWPFGIGMAFPLALLRFPTGREESPRWRRVGYAFVGYGLLFALQMGTSPDPFGPWAGVQSYLLLPVHARLEPLWTAANLLSLGLAALIVVRLVGRYRQGSEMVRRQLLWLLLAVVLAFAANAQRFATGDGPILLLLAFQLVPVAIAVAILRYQLFDIRLVVSRTVLYLALTAAVAAVYVGLVTLMDRLVRTGLDLGGSILATIVVALAFHPVRMRLQRVVDRLFYGERADPVRVVSHVGSRLLASTDADHVTALDALREALRLPYAAVRADGGTITESGTPTADVHIIPLEWGETAGQLVVGLRGGESAVADADRRVLEVTAVPLAMALRAGRLAEEVAASRGRIVAGQEEERKRLRRDLHDGLGPTLTGMAYKIDAVRNTLAADPARADAMLAELRATTAAAIDDVRRVVYGLRPPALDELGLAGALRQQAERLSGGGRALQVTVDAPAPTPWLPAAVEVAAYRIAVEAITNVARHSSARRACVGLAVAPDELRVTVTDDGAQSGTRWQPGVGLSAMAERAAEVGGRCTAGPTPDGGRVEAALPLEIPPTPDFTHPAAASHRTGLV
ncbi:histidine kinase [Pseudonocardia hierapolitana]|uniref:Histidine kinase n=1 Tax=Pseudonocardia hierapolitana TaxID=1128676 RepID=A0A561T410_9PSEU|nr:sensor histidine kinase [Pseudonocardia hierapolitana]TWF81835.1 histidine kinase [Pseudonocardia hierapolitana]